jgi:phosphinothricin acetyltransferase
VRADLGGVVVRTARLDDAAALLELYAPFVARTAVSFEEQVPSTGEFRQRIAEALERWAWVVAEAPTGPVGYAYATQHRARAAYRWSLEVSAYLAPEARGRGLGQALYSDLFQRLVAKGFRRAFAGVTLPNEASVRFHERAGFKPVGVFEAAGWKLGAWHDVAWFQRWLHHSPPEVG